MEEFKLSLPTAILININIMLGAGLFINTVELAKRAGGYGSFAYLMIGILLLPLIVSIAQLIKLYPHAGFYEYGARAIHPFVGFISAWSYFAGKIASSTLMVHVAMSLLYQFFPVLQAIPILAMDVAIFLLFIGLNLVDLRTSRSIQFGFLALKIIPVLLVLLSGFVLFNWSNVVSATIPWAALGASLPLVLYATAGFEVTCSLSAHIVNAKRNGPLAIFVSYSVVILVAFLYQSIFYGNLGSILAQQANYLGAFPSLINALFTNKVMIAGFLRGIINITIASSALGAAYGILFSNYWNLYRLAQAGHTIFQRSLLALNRFNLPAGCLLVEGIIGVIYILIIQGAQLPLQQTSALAGAIPYTLSVLALLATILQSNDYSRIWLPLLGLASCTLLLKSCISSFMISGIYPLFLFIFFISIGVIMYIYTACCNRSRKKDFSLESKE